jgi:hypothetical protein
VLDSWAKKALSALKKILNLAGDATHRSIHPYKWVPKCSTIDH